MIWKLPWKANAVRLRPKWVRDYFNLVPYTTPAEVESQRSLMQSESPADAHNQCKSPNKRRSNPQLTGLSTFWVVFD